MSSEHQDARRLAEDLARASYGRLLAIVAARTGDLSAAEDALAEAFAKAMEHWPSDGIPNNPEAWLVVTARRLTGHVIRHDQVRTRAKATIEMLYQETLSQGDGNVPDERLKLLFACAHPAIAAEMRTPLMLQTVLGLDAERIGRSFLESGSTMGQRLVRAKSKIKNAGIPFTVPERAELPARLQDVLNAIYAAFSTGWDDFPDNPDGSETLTDEAIYLAKLVTDLLADQAEPFGLLALMLYCEARRPARRALDGTFIPLSEQEPLLWNKGMIANAETFLRRAAALGQPGRYQTEAAIQSVHAGRLRDQTVDPNVLVRLYDVLSEQTSSIGAAVSRAAAYLEADQVEAAYRLLCETP